VSLFGRVRRSVERQRTAAATRVRPVDLAFGQQREAIECHEPFVVFCCSGRSGKSRGAVLKWLEVAERKPGELSCFIALTLAQAERIAWRQLKRVDKELGLGLKFNKGDHTISHPNGATLILLGANRDDLIDVLRGTPFAFVYFDEAAFFREGLLKQAVEDALLIRMMDLQGEMWVASTPGYVKAGYHYELVSGRKPGWRMFHWTYLDNPHLPELPWEPDDMKRRLLRIEAARKIREVNGWNEDSPSYVRDWLGRYTDDLESLVYAFRPEIHYVDDMPPSWYTNRERWHTVLGIDFGSTNATAWTVLAFEKHSPIVYVVETRKEYGMAPSLTADVTKTYIDTYHPDVVIGDSAAKGYIDEHRIRHQIAIELADKQGKRAHQMLLNDALRAVANDNNPAPRIRLVRGTCASLADELSKLGKDPRFGPNHERYGEENPNAENDQADSFLYGWWKCWAWLEEIRKAEDEAAEKERLSRLDPLGNTALQGIYGKPPPVAHEGLRGAFGMPALQRRLRQRR
jgi:hypothetical protein